MLGKLTRWLRILGQDVKYSQFFTDEQLLLIAKKEKRILLTTDRELHRRALIQKNRSLYVEGGIEEKISAVSKIFKIKLEVNMKKTRCPKCNSLLKSKGRQEVSSKLYKTTLIHHNDFWLCSECDKIYWMGAHWRNIRKSLNKSRKI